MDLHGRAPLLMLRTTMVRVRRAPRFYVRFWRYSGHGLRAALIASDANDTKRTLRGLKSRSAAVGSVVSSLHCMNAPQPEGHMASYIGRREFVATLGGAAAWPLAAVKLPRRNFLHLAAGAAALPAFARIAWAQAYPTRPVRLIVPVGPARATD